MEQGSQVARDMARIDLELEAVRRLEHDPAISARHDFIIARAQRGAERILRLVDEDRHEEAQALMNTDNWESRTKTSKREAKEKPGKNERTRKREVGDTKR